MECIRHSPNDIHVISRAEESGNEGIRKELDISQSFKKNSKYIDKLKIHLKTMEQTRIPLQTYDYRPSSRGDIRRPRTNGRRRNTLQAGTSVSPNPQKEVDTYYS